jgi:hypothetical protein
LIKLVEGRRSRLVLGRKLEEGRHGEGRQGESKREKERGDMEMGDKE